MNPLLSAKGGDVTTWRAVENFSSAYRQTLFDMAASDCCGGVEQVYSKAVSNLDAFISTHLELVEILNGVTDRIAAATPSTDLKALTESFYGNLYLHFEHFRSVPAFYQWSMLFLSRLSGAVAANAADELKLAAGALPEAVLIALGPAGRCEYSPSCNLQIMLVHEEATAGQLQLLERFCEALHAGFEKAGVTVDAAITPREPEWRGTLADWRRRGEDELKTHGTEELVNLYRLADHYPLYSSGSLAAGFSQMSGDLMRQNRSALSSLIERMAALSNGLGLMGRLKLERSGSERGMFKLLDHGLLPLSAALSVMALLMRISYAGSCERIRDLLNKRELDVEQTERILAAWHNLNELRLLRESSSRMDGHPGGSLSIDPDRLTTEQRLQLKDSLESVALFQRHVEITFSGMEE